VHVHARRSGCLVFIPFTSTCTTVGSRLVIKRRERGGVVSRGPFFFYLSLFLRTRPRTVPDRKTETFGGGGATEITRGGSGNVETRRSNIKIRHCWDVYVILAPGKISRTYYFCRATGRDAFLHSPVRNAITSYGFSPTRSRDFPVSRRPLLRPARKSRCSCF